MKSQYASVATLAFRVKWLLSNIFAAPAAPQPALAAAVAPVAPETPAATATQEISGHVVRSPMVGTFYRSLPRSKSLC